MNIAVWLYRARKCNSRAAEGVAIDDVTNFKRDSGEEETFGGCCDFSVVGGVHDCFWGCDGGL